MAKFVKSHTNKVLTPYLEIDIIEIAKNMLKKGIDIDTVMEITELTKEEIEKIK